MPDETINTCMPTHLVTNELQSGCESVECTLNPQPDSDYYVSVSDRLEFCFVATGDASIHFLDNMSFEGDFTNIYLNFLLLIKEAWNDTLRNW